MKSVHRLRLRATGLACVLSALLCGPSTRVAHAQINAWAPLGPGVGDIRSVAIDPTNPSTVYAGASDGRVFKSTNGGSGWSTLSMSATVSAPIYALVVDATNPSTLYAATSGVLKSTDEGGSWKALDTGFPIVYTLAIHPTSPSTLYAGTNSGVLKTTNGGATWKSLTSTSPVYALAIDPQTPSTLYAGMSGVLKSTDAGASWSPSNTGLPDGVSVSALAVDATRVRTVYAGTFGLGVFKSKDAGGTWTAASSGLTDLVAGNGNMYVNFLAQDPHMTGTLYAGTGLLGIGGGVATSTNGGATWGAAGTGLPNTQVQAVTFDPRGGPLYAGTRNGGLNGLFVMQPTFTACPPVPQAGCQSAASKQGTFRLRIRPGQSQGQLDWQWISSAATAKTDFGNPLAASNLMLCVYDTKDGTPRLRVSATAPATPVCAFGEPCWKESKTGYKYANKDLTQNHLTQVLLKSGAAKQARIRLKQKAATLSLPSMPLTAPFKVQLLRSDSPACWEATSFSATAGVTQFRAQASRSTFERLQREVFDVSCSSDSCHSSVGRAGNLVLEPGSSWNGLVNQSPSNPTAAAHGWMRVGPRRPATSFILAKLTDALAAGEGVPMPYSAAPLAVETVDIIRAWILAGAPADGVVPGDDGRALGGGGDMPGEITLPPPARGVQLAVTARALAPGTEETLCHYLKMPSDVDFDVNRFQVAVTGGSHHIHLYRPYQSGLDLPDGFEVCNKAVDFDKWELVLAAQLRRSDWELPAGVAFHFRAGEQLLIQTHFVNVGSLETIGEGKALMNLNEAEPGTTTAYAGSMFGQDKDVFVPAHSSPTEDALCIFPKALTMMAQTGHYHFRGRRFSTYRWDDGVRGEEIYHFEGYSDPKFLIYDPATSPQFTPGQGIQWECYWENTTDNDYKFGPFTDINEHCNWFGFYYPASSQNESITCVKQHGVSVTTVRNGQ